MLTTRLQGYGAGMESRTHKLRFGILGAARIAPKALIEPAAKIDTVEVTRVAARDPERARAFAAEHGIAKVSKTYAELIAADDVDVVYNPLPMSLHAEWSIAALRAGKDVFCEKPFASNAAEAAEMVRVAEEEGRVLGEAFHYRYHPVIHRIMEEAASGRIGDITRVEGYFAVTIPQPDLRWDYSTAGGATMDLGCYPVHWVRDLCGEPTVVSATAVEGPQHIDAELTMELAFANGATGLVHSSMVCEDDDIRLEVIGTTGSITAINPMAPQNGNSITITTGSGTEEERVSRGPLDAGISYDHMLRAFVDHVQHGSDFPTQGADSIANMAVIDAAYEAAGLPIRGASK